MSAGVTSSVCRSSVLLTVVSHFHRPSPRIPLVHSGAGSHVQAPPHASHAAAAPAASLLPGDESAGLFAHFGVTDLDTGEVDPDMPIDEEDLDMMDSLLSPTDVTDTTTGTAVCGEEGAEDDCVDMEVDEGEDGG